MSSWLALVLRSRVMVCMIFRSSLMDSRPATMSLRLVNETAWEYSASCSVTILPLAWRMLFRLISSSSKLVLRRLSIASFVLLRYSFTSFRLIFTLLGNSLVPSCMYSFVTKAQTTPNLKVTWNRGFVVLSFIEAINKLESSLDWVRFHYSWLDVFIFLSIHYLLIRIFVWTFLWNAYWPNIKGNKCIYISVYFKFVNWKGINERKYRSNIYLGQWLTENSRVILIIENPFNLFNVCYRVMRYYLKMGSNWN